MTTTHVYSGKKLSLLGRAEVAQVYREYVITYCLTMLPCPRLWLVKLAHFLFRFWWTRWFHLAGAPSVDKNR